MYSEQAYSLNICTQFVNVCLWMFSSEIYCSKGIKHKTKKVNIMRQCNILYDKHQKNHDNYFKNDIATPLYMLVYVKINDT